MNIKKLSAEANDLYESLREEIDEERYLAKRELVKERIKEVDAAERVLRKLKKQLKASLELPLDEFSDELQ